jgi:hypothetical protein
MVWRPAQIWSVGQKVDDPAGFVRELSAEAASLEVRSDLNRFLLVEDAQGVWSDKVACLSVRDHVPCRGVGCGRSNRPFACRLFSPSTGQLR